MSKRQVREPQLGIVYVVNGRLWLQASAFDRAEEYGDCKTHLRSHEDFWEELVRTRAVPDDEYFEHPRGRVTYNTRTGNFTLFADRCILRDKRLLRNILRQLNLRVDNTDTATDPHYRCYQCLESA